MVRTSTAEKNGYRCPACGDELKQDNAVRGYATHVSNPNCMFEKGEKDDVAVSAIIRPVTHPVVSTHEPADGVRVCGYSERGIFNALLYEIGFSADPVSVLRRLLSLVCIPGSATGFSNLQGAEVLVEQSLSDFGDADAILLLHGPDWRSALFMEGKVKPSQVGRWTVHGAWGEFLTRKRGKLDSSNLFTQLYHKVRLVAALREGGLAAVKRGVEFPMCSTKTRRMLGSNPVVQRTAQMIEGYSGQSFYIAVVPDSTDRLADFFANELRDGPAKDVSGWDIGNWGYLTWEQVERFCDAHSLSNTLRVFDFNRGQIY